jgi:hypothetical protein
MTDKEALLTSARRVWPMLRTAIFQKPVWREIPGRSIAVNPTAVSKSFFYPIYYVSEARNAWGNLVGDTHNAGHALQQVLEGMHHRFRAGSTWSISFSLGFALVLQSKKPDVNWCLQFEPSRGLLTQSPDQKSQTERLLVVLGELADRELTTSQAVEMAIRILGKIGRLEGETLLLAGSRQNICLFTPRKMISKEALFINRKINDHCYCSQFSRAYASETGRLESMPLTEIDHFQLDVPPGVVTPGWGAPADGFLHRLCGSEGRPDPPDTLHGRGDGARDAGQLRGAGSAGGGRRPISGSSRSSRPRPVRC